MVVAKRHIHRDRDTDRPRYIDCKRQHLCTLCMRSNIIIVVTIINRCIAPKARNFTGIYVCTQFSGKSSAFLKDIFRATSSFFYMSRIMLDIRLANKYVIQSKR